MAPPPPDDDLPRRREGPFLLATAGFTALVTLASFGALGAWRDARGLVDPALLARARAEIAVRSLPPPAAPSERFEVSTRRLARDQTVAQALSALGLDSSQVQAVVAALQDLFPFRRARPGDQLRLERRAGDRDLHRFTYRQGPADEWIVRAAEGGALRGEKRAVDLRSEVARVAVSLQGSLYETLQAAGEDPLLAVEAADVLAWDVDFYQDVRAGDRMKILVEKVWADGHFLRYGAVLAAEYDGATTGRKRLFRYTDPEGRTSYYDDDGNSARRGFLRSPLPYAHLTSRFGSRFHPVLQYLRAHQGVDYGAPEGTPVWAVGDGSVVQAGWNGGCGESVTLRHANGFQTVYCHLSSVRVAPGAHVSQKQVVGLVGRTGVATGTHLHYAVRRQGAYVNPLRLEIPRGVPVPDAWRPDFAAKIGSIRARLDESPVARRAGARPPPPAHPHSSS
jgi:murein DD-endopeptidase MepM/ murein hydrolase activator NlpD